ncbi:MAG: hypothetical protein PHQ01_03640 [Candidatus Pacebacteria bacterium]|nr:hypothetical protein [Candidatus Paceibacterota bacterium]
MAQLVYKNLLGKSIEAITMAIEIYNKPLTKYRSETSIILIVNAWENALKALISKKRWAKIYNRKKEESKPFEECVLCVKSNLGKMWKESVEDSISMLYKERCKIVHYNKGLAILDYMLIQKNILFFKEFIDQNFGISIVKDKNWFILPIGTELPFDQFNLLSCESSIKNSPNDVKKYFEDIIESHNKHVSQGNSILMELNVTLQNVNRINQSDLVIGINPNISKKTSIGYKSLTLDKTGKAISVKEFTEIIENYPLRYSDMIDEYKNVLKEKNLKFNQKKVNKKMKIIKEDARLSYDWAGLSHVLPIKIPQVFSYSKNTINELLKI